MVITAPPVVLGSVGGHAYRAGMTTFVLVPEISS